MAVPTIVSYSSLHGLVEQNVVIPVPHGRDRVGGVFSVYTQNRVQQRLVEQSIFLQRLPSRSLTFQFRVGAEFFIQGFFTSQWKKVRGQVRTRGRNWVRTSLHPRRRLIRRVSSRMRLVCGCSFLVVGGNFWARMQKSGGLGDGWNGALVMHASVYECFWNLCACAVRTWNLVHCFRCPCFWQLLFRASGYC